MFTYVLVGLLLGLILVLAFQRRTRATEAFAASIVRTKPTLYWILDVEKNARAPWDFGAPNSSQPNAPYLQVALDAVHRTQGADYTIVPLIGREAVARELGMPAEAGAGMPVALWRAWAIANLAARRGGLCMDGASTLCLGPSFAPVLSNIDAAVFGVVQDEPVVGTSAVAPGAAPYAAWAVAPNMPAWTGAAAVWNRIANAGPTSWTAALAARTAQEVHALQVSEGISVIRYAELSRHPNGKPIVLEDLFGGDALDVPPTAVYLAYDGDALARRHEFNWVLRLTSDELRNGEFVWASLAFGGAAPQAAA